MKAVRFHEYGDPDVLRYEDIEIPTPGPGEVRLRVAASAFNPVDDGIRGGYLRDVFPVTLPHTPGIDIAGTVDALGEGVTGSQVGDDVIGFLPIVADGGAAEFVVAPAEALAPAPASVPLADAAAMPMVALTAWQALFDDAGLTAGQSVLINGAGGAVGGYAAQLAKHSAPQRRHGRSGITSPPLPPPPEGGVWSACRSRLPSWAPGREATPAAVAQQRDLPEHDCFATTSNQRADDPGSGRLWAEGRGEPGA